MEILFKIIISYFISGWIVYHFVYPEIESRGFYLWYKHLYSGITIKSYEDKTVLDKAAGLSAILNTIIFMFLMII